jgi:fructose-bisphosphate aldolase class II
MKEICKARFEAFGSAGHAGKITPLSLDHMAAQYKNGALDAKVS